MTSIKRIYFIAFALLTLACNQQKNTNSKSHKNNGETGQESKSAITNVSASSAQAMIQENKNLVVVDLRTAPEYKNAHIKGAKNIDFRAENFVSKIEALNKKKSYLIYCQSGSRSEKTASMMNRKGFTSVKNMYKGLYSWSLEGLPLVSDNTKSAESFNKDTKYFIDHFYNDAIVYVYFYTEDCKICPRGKEKIKKFVQGNKNRVSTAIDADQRQDLLDYFNVAEIPTLFMYIEGHLFEQKTGEITTNDLREAVNRAS